MNTTLTMNSQMSGVLRFSRRPVPPGRHGLFLFHTQRYSSSVSPVFTSKSYKPFAHYSQAIKANNMVWLSGQIPADVNGQLIQGTTEEKTRTIIQNSGAILEAAGSSFAHVVKVVVYLRDAGAMPGFSRVFDPTFPHRPARSMVEVSHLPAGVDIQVDFTAVVE